MRLIQYRARWYGFGPGAADAQLTGAVEVEVVVLGSQCCSEARTITQSSRRWTSGWEPEDSRGRSRKVAVQVSDPFSF
jgi:hypothetical protein